jgi:hypothetical protein
MPNFPGARRELRPCSTLHVEPLLLFCNATGLNTLRSERKKDGRSLLQCVTSIGAGTQPHDFALLQASALFCEAIMRAFSRMVVVATVPALMGIQTVPAAAQSFNERWSIIPKAHAEPAPEATAPAAQEPETTPPVGVTKHDSDHSRSYNRVFSGKASYYSYQTGKTASGSSFDRDLQTAAHRSLPFGTKVRVTDPATSKSVVVRITDRGPRVRGRILDLSLGAARRLGITDRGVAQVRVEVL